MKAADRLKQQWKALAPLWRDEAAQRFKTKQLAKILECMGRVSRQRARFESAVAEAMSRIRRQ